MAKVVTTSLSQVHLRLAVAVCGLGSLGLAACATVPPEAVQLSSMMNERVHDAHVAHVEAVRTLMNEKRRQIEDFLEEDWLPAYSREYLSDPRIDGMFDRVCSQGDAEDRLTFSLIIAEETQSELQRIRGTLMGQVDETEHTLLSHIQRHYSLTSEMGRALTAHLQSVVDVDEQREQLLESAGIDTERIDEQMSRFRDRVDRLTAPLDDLDALEQRIQDFSRDSAD